MEQTEYLENSAGSLENFINKIICGDALEVLKTFPDECINCVFTSPPYWSLRDYGVDGQLGLEPTFQEYLDHLITIFDEVKRVLRKDGTCWVVMGDTYFSGGGKAVKQSEKRQSAINADAYPNYAPNSKLRSKLGKSLALIPSRFAIMMIDHGWILRNEIIWHKPNALPSSVKDRFTVDFEKVFFFTKSQKYYFEQQFEPLATTTVPYTDVINPKLGRNKRCVWNIPTRSFSEAHFAVFPPDLVKPMILAGCPELVCNKCGKPVEKNINREVIKCKAQPYTANTAFIHHGEGKSTLNSEIIRKIVGYSLCDCKAGFHPGIILDPFIGSGTTALVARALNRNYIGIDLNPEYVKIALKRLEKVSGQSQIDF